MAARHTAAMGGCIRAGNQVYESGHSFQPTRPDPRASLFGSTFFVDHRSSHVAHGHRRASSGSAVVSLAWRGKLDGATYKKSRSRACTGTSSTSCGSRSEPSSTSSPRKPRHGRSRHRCATTEEGRAQQPSGRHPGGDELALHQPAWRGRDFLRPRGSAHGHGDRLLVRSAVKFYLVVGLLHAF